MVADTSFDSLKHDMQSLSGKPNPGKILNDVIKELCIPQSYQSVYHRSNHDIPMPSVEVLSEIVELLRSVLFPGYFGNSEIKPETMTYYMGSTVDRVYTLFTEQIKRGYCFSCNENDIPATCEDCDARSRDTTIRFMEKLPVIRHLLSTDVAAAYEGDPAAHSYGEAVFCYPSIFALTNHRIAHELYRLEVPIIPRIISEMAHSRTGIDIHPGARIDEHFFIDHGTGVVIGETSVIRKNVRIYQGVTLGGTGKEKGRRHPTIEPGCVIGVGAKVLGAITVGRGSRVGAGAVVIKDVPPHSTVVGVPGRIVARDGERVQPLEHGHLPDPVQDLLQEERARRQELERRLAFLERRLEAVLGASPKDELHEGRLSGEAVQSDPREHRAPGGPRGRARDDYDQRL